MLIKIQDFGGKKVQNVWRDDEEENRCRRPVRVDPRTVWSPGWRGYCQFQQGKQTQLLNAMFITSTHNKSRKTLKARLFNSLTPNLLPQNVGTQYRLKDNGEILQPFLPIRYCSVTRNMQPWEWWARYCGLSSSSMSGWWSKLTLQR